MSFTDSVKNFPRLPNGGSDPIGFLTTIADPSRSFRMTFNVLYKDHGVGRQKKLLAHAVRLRILACRNDLNRKRIVSLQLTADSSQLIAFIFLPSVITQNGGRKRIFILFFCVIPPSQYPPSGFAGHLLINKEAYPIPILPVRIPFLNIVADPSLAL